MGYMTIKLLVDLEEGISTVSLTTIARDQCYHALLNMDGKITECE